MKITVINGTQKQGITYRMKELFLAPLKDKAQITEFYLPRDCPSFCVGCITCFSKDQKLCKDAGYIQKIEKALLEADLLVFTSPSYVMHATGAMKAMLDHFGYRWMPHRPAKEMFSKRAVIITQALGAGENTTAKDIKHSLSWWGVSDIKVLSFKLLSNVEWDKIPVKKTQGFESKLKNAGRRYVNIDYSRPAHTKLATKAKFYMVRMMQTNLGKENPQYTDFNYWKDNGWLDKTRPWKE